MPSYMHANLSNNSSQLQDCNSNKVLLGTNESQPSCIWALMDRLDFHIVGKYSIGKNKIVEDMISLHDLLMQFTLKLFYGAHSTTI